MKFEHGIVGRTTDGFFRYQGWPSIACDKDGTLFAVCSGHRLAHICPFGKNLMYVSRDGGKTWSMPVLVNDTYLDDRDAGLITWGEGDMMLTWFNNDASVYTTEKVYTNNHSPMSLGMREQWESLDRETEYLVGSWCKVSHDKGFTWEEKSRCPVSSPHGPVRLKDGRFLYVGTAPRTVSPKELWGTIQAYVSADEGKTWEHLSQVPHAKEWKNIVMGEPCEPHCVELPNGDLLVAIRAWVEGKIHHYMHTSIVRSTDGGKSWSEPEVLDDAVGAPAHLLVHSSGAVILSYGKRVQPYGEYARISYDNGKSWSEELLLEAAIDSDLGYPATAELPDGSLVTVYYQKYGSDPHPSILYTKWALPER
ncbi:MAG: exo-alpha-sialidase [Clostridia bacterium]|nr:exo-alpha-sialidase [Clostridia bacterium]